MTKWFDTNYHYLVPEFTADTAFSLADERLFADVAEAQALGHPVKAVLLGLRLLYLGKEKVADCFTDLGVSPIDADQAARWVVEPGRPALTQIVERFGASVLLADGQLDRKALRGLIFQTQHSAIGLKPYCTR